MKPLTRNLIKHIFYTYKSVKAQIVTWVVYRREISPGLFEKTPLRAVYGELEMLFRLSQFNNFFDRSFSKIDTTVSFFEVYGSGCVLDKVIGLDVKIVTYRPLKVSCWIELPPSLKNKKGLVNIRNYDDQCFKWAVLSVLHKNTRKFN